MFLAKQCPTEISIKNDVQILLAGPCPTEIKNDVQIW